MSDLTDKDLLSQIRGDGGMNWTTRILIAAAIIMAFGRYAGATECFHDGISALRAHPEYNHASYRTIKGRQCWFGDRKEVMRNDAGRSRLGTRPLSATGAAPSPREARADLLRDFGVAMASSDPDFADKLRAYGLRMIAERGR